MLTLDEHPLELSTPVDRWRRPLLIVGGGLAVSAIAYCAFSAVVLLARQSQHGGRVVAVGEATSVRLDTHRCDSDVTVVGEDRSDVSMTWNDSWSLRRPRHAESLVGSELQIDAFCPYVPTWGGGSDVVMHVPRSMRITGYVDSGELSVRAVTGGVDVSDDSGDVEVSDVAGAIRIRADSGAVQAHLVDGTTDLRIDADSGSIRVDAPVATRWRVDARSDSGSKRIEVEQAAGAPLLSLRADSGSIRVSYR